MRLPSSGEKRIALVCVQSGKPIGRRLIKFIPKPDGLVILIQIYNQVSSHRRSGNVFLRRSKNDQVAVGQQYKVMVCPDDGNIASGTCGVRQSGSAGNNSAANLIDSFIRPALAEPRSGPSIVSLGNLSLTCR